ncbi:DNA ligase D [Paenalcaligenes niemegkensis]|uniref:DNA ligase D n=1 Tax=Paenalcaligenes niemegkensis TaxID=2895469 RepID=UPI001EE7CBCB|nr:DNA ligase D [Paenalcaligenes niemegkensis]MCQ9616108.1 DNA ligase D [Paenalcaligenes niemegkensis]
MARDPLVPYKSKRNFSLTPEPEQGGTANDGAPVFVIQKHWARSLHYDFRLELDGVMKSWAIPKGPSLDPADKRMAVHVEDHPLSYNQFEGQIPKGEYGAGKVIIWDRGTWTPEPDPRKAYRAGKLKFVLNGSKLQGGWALVRMRGDTRKQDAWLLIKEKDEFARPALSFSVVDELPDSVGPEQNERSQPKRKSSVKTVPKGAVRDMAFMKAPKATLPESFKPQLATLADAPPPDPQSWLYELKFDGYRLLARIDKGKVRLMTRNAHDWTDRLPHLAKALLSLKLPSGWYDGEIVLINDRGLPDFQALQNAFDSAKTSSIRYFLFDLPYFQGADLRGLPLTRRREALEHALQGAIVGEGSVVQLSAIFDASLRDIQESACRLGLEGVIAKHQDSPYVSRRSKSWLKLKCGHRQEFVIGGYTQPRGTRIGIGALLLGVHDEHGILRYAGKVGTGFSSRSLRDIHQRLDALQSNKRPFGEDVPGEQLAHWVEPTLLAEVSFAQWTSGGRIRHAVFHGLRSDKAAKAIIREENMTATTLAPKANTPAGKQKKESPQSVAKTKASAAATSRLGQLRVTHPERVVDFTTKTRKIDVVRYYGLIAPLMMPHLKGRPVSLVRAPDGVKGQIFFQKHLETNKMAGMRSLPARLDPGHDPLVEVSAEKGLSSAAQMNVMEFHTWNAVNTLIGKPDRMTFDLDPGKGVDWALMQQAALLLQVFLSELGLTAFVKTSGGKGLHVVVPLQRRHDWETVKGVSQAVVQHLAKTFPKRFAAKSGPRNRVGKIFIDYLRNGWGATTVSAWSLRARPGMGVSVPIEWDEVEQITSATQWHIGNIHERLDVGNAPWAEYASSAATLTQAMRTLKYSRA